MPVTLMSVPSVPEQVLPTGIECRTPSPEPQLDRSNASLCDSCATFELDLYARQSLDAYNFEVAADHEHQQDTYLDQLKIYEIATRKLKTAYFPWDMPAQPEQPAGLQDFRHRNALLAVLEPAISDKKQLCTKHLQNYVATFLDCPELSLFNRRYVLPALSHDGRSGETAAMATKADSFIQMGINLLHLSADTMKLIEMAASSDRRSMLDEDVFATPYEGVINPAILDVSLVTNIPTMPFDTFDFEVSEEELADSTGSSPTTTTFSASDHAMSPFTHLDGSSPATQTESLELNVSPAATRCQVDDPDIHLLLELDLSVSLYQSGDSASAVMGLRSVATSRNLSTARGKVLTRLAWFCLSCIHRQEGMSEQAGQCLAEAVRGSMNFRDDRGEDWHEVSHLFH